MQKIGKYQILDKVGQGGMGIVYKALDPLIERVVAVKTISTNLDADPELRARFFREGRSAGHLSHKNIVTIFDLGEENGMAYLAMEFLEGEDLRTKISRGTPLPLQEKIRIMVEMCEGLAHAHERNVIHRDVKPANIFITKTGQIKILDFGLARMESSDLTTSNRALGTPNYMSPEQVRGEKVDNRTDIFSVGVVSYELLTYRKAFQGDSYTSTIFKILQDEPEPVDHFDSTISAELSAIVTKALAKDRDQRYQSLGEVLRDLEVFCGRTQASPDAVGTREMPRCEGHRPSLSPRVSAQGPGANQKTSGSPTPTPRGTRPEPMSKPAAPGSFGLGQDDPTQTETLPPPGATHRFSRRLAATCISIATLFCITWMLTHHYRAGRAGAASDRTASAVEQPRAAPASPQSQSQPQSRSEPAPVPDDQLAAKLAKVSSDMNSGRFSEAVQGALEILAVSPGNMEAQSVLLKARESLNSIRVGLRKANSFMASRDYPHAREALDAVLVVSPSEKEALRLVSQLNRIEHRRADEAIGLMKEAKSRAGDAHAQELALQSSGAAKDAETEANRLYAEGKFAQAAARYGEATDLYSGAEKEARTFEASRAEKLRRDELARQKELQRNKSDASRQAYEHERERANQAGAASKAHDQFGQGEKLGNSARAKSDNGDLEGAASDYDAAAAAMRSARTVALEAAQRESSRSAESPKLPQPTAAEQPAPEAHESVEEERKVILGLPVKYKAAMENKDLSLLKSIWPVLGVQQEQAIRNQWAYTRSLRITLRDLEIKTLEKDSAVLTVLLHNEQQIDNGVDKKWDQRATFGLIRKKGTWVIESTTFEVVR